MSACTTDHLSLPQTVFLSVPAPPAECFYLELARLVLVLAQRGPKPPSHCKLQLLGLVRCGLFSLMPAVLMTDSHWGVVKRKLLEQAGEAKAPPKKNKKEE